MPGSVYRYLPKGQTINKLGLEQIEKYYESLTHFKYNLTFLLTIYSIVANRESRTTLDQCLLVLDSYESYTNYLFFNFIQKYKILVQVLSAHFSYFIQLLDVGFFSLLQNNYGKLVIDWSKGSRFSSLYKSDFFPLLKIARE